MSGTTVLGVAFWGVLLGGAVLKKATNGRVGYKDMLFGVTAVVAFVAFWGIAIVLVYELLWAPRQHEVQQCAANGGEMVQDDPLSGSYCEGP